MLTPLLRRAAVICACLFSPLAAQAVTIDTLDIKIGIPGGGLSVNLDDTAFLPNSVEAGTGVANGIFADVTTAFTYSVIFDWLTVPRDGYFVSFEDIRWDTPAMITSASIVSGRTVLVKNFGWSANSIYFETINPEVTSTNPPFGLYNRWDIAVTLADTNGNPLTPAVPVPASLPLLLAALTLLPVLRRFRAR